MASAILAVCLYRVPPRPADMRLVIGGPPHRGKSTATVALMRLLAERLDVREESDELRFVTLDVADNTARYLLGHDDELKTGGQWTTEARERKLEEYEASEAHLVLSDAPGVIDDHTRQLLAKADAILVLAWTEEEMKPWIELAEDLGIRVFGLARSVPPQAAERSRWDSGGRRGVLRGLEREAVRRPEPLALPPDTQDALIQIARQAWEEARA